MGFVIFGLQAYLVGGVQKSAQHTYNAFRDVRPSHTGS